MGGLAGSTRHEGVDGTSLNRSCWQSIPIPHCPGEEGGAPILCAAGDEVEVLAMASSLAWTVVVSGPASP